MATLVTGGAGYIGAHMTHALRDAGESVVMIDDLSTGFASACAEGIVFVQADMADKALVSRLIEDHMVDTVIHFAAKSIVPESVAQPFDYYRSNVAKMVEFLDAAVSAGATRVVFSSSAAVYGSQAMGIVPETAHLSPESPYGATKLTGERLVQDAASAHGISFAILRYFNVAGADPKGRIGQSTKNATHLIKVAIQAALGLRPYLEVYGDDYPTPDGTCIRDYIHVTDLISAHQSAQAHLRSGGENLILNCGYGRGSSVQEVIAAVQEVSGREFEVRRAPRRKGDVPAIAASDTLIKQKLKWSPEWNDLRVIVEHALRWEERLVRDKGTC